MRDVELQEALLVDESNLSSAHLTIYRSWCAVFKQVDVEESLIFLNKDVRPKAICAKRQWLKSLGRLSLIAAHSEIGLMAKGRALQNYFSERPADDVEARTLMGSFFADLEHVLEKPLAGSADAPMQA